MPFFLLIKYSRKFLLVLNLTGSLILFMALLILIIVKILWPIYGAPVVLVVLTELVLVVLVVWPQLSVFMEQS